MFNRWYHAPTLHSPEPGKGRRVGWLELFYDLIYVATIVQLGVALERDLSLTGVLGFVGLFVPIWWSWTGFTFYSNRFIVDDFMHRVAVFAQMFGIGAVAVCTPDVLRGETYRFALAYAWVRLVLVGLYGRTWLQLEEARELTGRYTIGFGVGALLWLVSAWVPSPWVYVVWVVALLVDFGATFSRRAQDLIGRYPPDILHMSERYGVLTLIVLGISFVRVLGGMSSNPLLDMKAAVAAGLALLITGSVWWIYFDDVAGVQLKRGRFVPLIWVYTHLPLTVSVTALGVALKVLIVSGGWAAVEGDGGRWLLCGALSALMLSVGVIDSVTERRQAELSDRARVNARWISAGLLLVVGWVGGFVAPWVVLGLIALVCGVQVWFDLSMAPHSERERSYHRGGVEAAEVASAGPQDQWTNAHSERWDVTDAVRRGAPSALRRDLYFYFMAGGWGRLLGSLLLIYLMINLVFAALYIVEPGSVANARLGSFVDAFFFSVQTISTIGYGAMSPSSDYANVLVTVEAVVGVLGVAMATGLMFAKASRPKASVLFSDVCVVTRYEGTPSLMFRVGNARGNEVVEASMRLTLLKDEVSPEGHRLRKLYDLKLRRDTSPLFVLSWVLIHPIDEESPLYGVTQEGASEQIAALIATMTGFDATYAHTTHARCFYYPEQLRWGHRFVDVISNLSDGRMVIDYNAFHQTHPEGEGEEGVDGVC